jgi:hypothetical protein
MTFGHDASNPLLCKYPFGLVLPRVLVLYSQRFLDSVNEHFRRSIEYLNMEIVQSTFTFVELMLISD